MASARPRARAVINCFFHLISRGPGHFRFFRSYCPVREGHSFVRGTPWTSDLNNCMLLECALCVIVDDCLCKIDAISMNFVWVFSGGIKEPLAVFMKWIIWICFEAKFVMLDFDGRPTNYHYLFVLFESTSGYFVIRLWMLYYCFYYRGLWMDKILFNIKNFLLMFSKTFRC